MSLRRFAVEQRQPERDGAEAEAEQCEMCAEAIAEDHGHVVNLEDRRILCTCRACTLLFTHEGAGGRSDAPVRRFHTVPDRYRFDPLFVLPDADWDELAIPVRMAFFFRNSAMDRTIAFYPSPGGATESELPMEAWDRVLTANPAMADVAPDVEALLIDRGSGAYLVPIHACYALVGLVRLHWQGFDGGEEAWKVIDEYFTDLRRRAGADHD
ncbi:MAG TPA: DUF5947 family protein [Actinomadura sp.]|jgi:hypothetical protein|nr:DUF5947 family protein [Actinomadura sp.]